MGVVDQDDCMCKGAEVEKVMALPCKGPELALEKQAGDTSVHHKEFDIYSESAGESPRIFKQIWKISHNGRIGWRRGRS